jgi:hypothetical protein
MRSTNRGAHHYVIFSSFFSPVPYLKTSISSPPTLRSSTTTDLHFADSLGIAVSGSALCGLLKLLILKPRAHVMSFGPFHITRLCPKPCDIYTLTVWIFSSCGEVGFVPSPSCRTNPFRCHFSNRHLLHTNFSEEL